jgi:hypothetical protein
MIIAAAMLVVGGRMIERAWGQGQPREEWTVEVDVQIDAGEPDKLYRSAHFPSEGACTEFVLSPAFQTELLALLNAIQDNTVGGHGVSVSNFTCVKVPDEGEPA